MGPVTTNGKQVLMNGQHIADAIDEVTAQAIADAMNIYYDLGGKLQ